MIRMAAAAMYSVVPILFATAPNECLLLTGIAAAATVQYVRFEPLARFIVALQTRTTRSRRSANAHDLQVWLSNMSEKAIHDSIGKHWTDMNDILRKTSRSNFFSQRGFSVTFCMRRVRDKRSQLYWVHFSMYRFCAGYERNHIHLCHHHHHHITHRHHHHVASSWLYSSFPLIQWFGRREMRQIRAFKDIGVCPGVW